MPTRRENGEGLSTFEQRRLQNIAANNAILKNISRTAAKIAQPAAPPKPTGRPRSKRPVAARKEVPRREGLVATRTSSRLKGEDPDGHQVKRKAEDSAGVPAFPPDRPTQKAKIRVNNDLSLGDVLVEGRKFATDVGAITGLISLPRREAEPGVRTFDEDDIKETTDHDLRGLREEMSSLELYGKWSVNDIKIVPQRIYSMGFHPTTEKALVFAGDKEGAIGIFDASQDVPEALLDDDGEEADGAESAGPVVTAFTTHASTISSLHFPFANLNTVYTASYDSTIRRLDLGLGTPVSIQVYAPDEDEDVPISAIDMAPSEGNVIMFSTLFGSVGRHDFRTKGETEIWDLCKSKIGGLALHPHAPHLLATASLDKTLKVWDLRKIAAGQGDSRQPTMVMEHGSRLSVSHASWSPKGHIATSSYDDTIKIYDLSDATSWKVGHRASDAETRPSRVVKHNNQTGRWVTILKPQWQRSAADGIQKLAIGNMNRFVDIYDAQGEQVCQLDGDGITAVPAVAHLHPTHNWVVGGTASGKVCLWM